ncbi:MAG TPA: WhiB family transcriptional regulator [Acidimicrobiia bacterium]|nr:WhiB family transcriptional regulator [Acidimicrobiia bacterium]
MHRTIAADHLRLGFACVAVFASLPERREERDAREAKAKMICGDCAVQRECLDFALRVREPHGIWGGFTEAERRRQLPDD